MKADNLTGKRFGRLVVLELAEPLNGKRRFKCLCDCGNIAIVFSSNLKRGNTTSCGCARVNKIVTLNKKHGMKGTKLYGIWMAMRSRCNNPNNKAFHRYGGRGIKCCQQWEEFSSFLEWATANGYKEGLSLDRIDNDGPYAPENCRWATNEQQSTNTSKNVFLTYQGETKTLSQWCKVVGSYEARLSWRYKQGWPVEEILFGRKRKVPPR